MKVIFKYGPLTPSFDCSVQGRIVSVGIQNSEIYVWAEQGEDLQSFKVKFVATGQGYDGDYVGTVFEANGLLVWHVIREVK